MACCHATVIVFPAILSASAAESPALTAASVTAGIMAITPSNPSTNACGPCRTIGANFSPISLPNTRTSSLTRSCSLPIPAIDCMTPRKPRTPTAPVSLAILPNALAIASTLTPTIPTLSNAPVSFCTSTALDDIRCA